MVIIYLVSNSMLHFQPTYILSCILEKTAKIVSFFASKSDILIARYILGKCMYCYYSYIYVLSYQENDVHIVNISNGDSIYHCTII